MTRMVQCKKLGESLPGLTFPPMKGPLGERIFAEISQQAWDEWIQHSIMVINEYRLNPSEPQGQEILLKQMEQFLFGGGSEAPPEFKPAADGAGAGADADAGAGAAGENDASV